MIPIDTNTTTGTLAQGSVSALAVVFLSKTFTLMFPFIFVAITLIIADLFFGVNASRKRGERIRISRAIRRTTNKLFEYVCWIIVSATLAVAFNLPSLNWIILAIVVGNELISIISNWMEMRGKKITGLHEALFKWVGNKAGVDTSSVKVEDIENKKQ